MIVCTADGRYIRCAWRNSLNRCDLVRGLLLKARPEGRPATDHATQSCYRCTTRTPRCPNSLAVYAPYSIGWTAPAR